MTISGCYLILATVMLLVLELVATWLILATLISLELVATWLGTTTIFTFGDLRSIGDLLQGHFLGRDQNRIGWLPHAYPLQSRLKMPWPFASELPSSEWTEVFTSYSFLSEQVGEWSGCLLRTSLLRSDPKKTGPPPGTWHSLNQGYTSGPTSSVRVKDWSSDVIWKRLAHHLAPGIAWIRDILRDRPLRCGSKTDPVMWPEWWCHVVASSAYGITFEPSGMGDRFKKEFNCILESVITLCWTGLSQQKYWNKHACDRCREDSMENMFHTFTIANINR